MVPRTDSPTNRERRSLRINRSRNGLSIVRRGAQPSHKRRGQSRRPTRPSRLALYTANVLPLSRGVTRAKRPATPRIAGGCSGLLGGSPDYSM
jgi:hypothetical protein